MIPFKLGNESFHLPTGWHELTIGQMIDLRRNVTHDVFVMMSILMGIDISVWQQAIEHKVDLQILLSAIDWMKEPVNFRQFKIPVCNHIEINGVLHKLPSYKEFFASIKYIEKIDLDGVSDSEGDIIDAAPRIIAIAFYRAITGDKYDNEKLDDIIALCRKCKFTEVFPVARFFLRKYLGCGAGKTESCVMIRKMRKSAQVSMTSEYMA